jgi:hypothetical protein
MWNSKYALFHVPSEHPRGKRKRRKKMDNRVGRELVVLLTKLSMFVKFLVHAWR